MADEFDPLKQSSASAPAENLYATIEKVSMNKNEVVVHSNFENNTTVQSIRTSTNIDKNSDDNLYEKLDFTTNASKYPIRSTSSENEDLQKTVSSSFYNVPQRSQSNIPSPSDNQNYATGPPPVYAYEESGRQRGLSATIDRLVHRFPILGIFYRSSPDSAPEYYENYQETQGTEDEQPPQLVDENAVARELTSEELSLRDRYSNKLQTRLINLQRKNETQPVDVSVHHDTYTLYVCDAGRNVIEIFDFNGNLHHVINDSSTIKFQPTSVAVAYDGTIMAASEYSHRLQMYLPAEFQEDQQNANSNDEYSFKQYKLGSPGHNRHQFQYPSGIAIDHTDGYLYICDRGNCRIQAMKPEGVCERVIHLLLNDGNSTQIAPLQLAHQQKGDHMVCIVDTGDAICFIPKHTNGSIYVDPLYVLDHEGLGLADASGIAIDSNDIIFISDTGHNRIVICTSDGSYITHFGTEGSGPGELKYPWGLDITTDGTIVVADNGNKRIQLFGLLLEHNEGHNATNTDKSNDLDDLLIDPGKVAT